MSGEETWRAGANGDGDSGRVQLAVGLALERRFKSRSFSKDLRLCWTTWDLCGVLRER